MKMKQLCIILQLFIVSSICSCNQSINKRDFIDHSMNEFSKYFEPNNVFMIIECTEAKHVIKIHVESTNRKRNFLGNFYTYCIKKNNCIDIIVNDNCIDIVKLTKKELKAYSDIIEKDTIYGSTGDDSLTDYKFIFILYDIQSNKILKTEKFNNQW